MANPKRGEADIVLDERQYRLVFDWNAICDIENAFGGRSIDSMIQSGFSRSALREAIRVGLIRKYKPYTAKQVGKMLAKSIETPDVLKKLWAEVVGAIMAANGEEDDTVESFRKIILGEEDDQEAPTPRENDDDDNGSVAIPLPEEKGGTGTG